LLKEQEIDVVVHLAARPGVRLSLIDPRPYFQINVDGTLSLLEACRYAGVQRFIFASSSSVYGEIGDGPASEDSTPCYPLSPYGASKLAGEAICRTYSYLYSLSVVALRFFTVYGPRQRPDMAIHHFTRLIDKGEEVAILGDGRTTRDFTYISDIIDGVETCVETPMDGFQTLNLGGASPVDLLTVIELIARGLGKSARLRFKARQPGEPSSTFADIQKAGKLLNFRPRVGFEEGIEKFVDWYKERRGAQVELL
jgi:UDP-glucuronate 4-epimerase